MKKANIIELTFLFSWLAAIIVSVVTYFITGDFNMVVSYLLGFFSVMLMQSMNYRIMKNLYKNNPSRIKSTTIIIYLVKYIFFAIMLYVAHIETDWNVFFTFGGIMTYRVVMYPVVLIYAKKGEDKDA